jgi:hypothetical protein
MSELSDVLAAVITSAIFSQEVVCNHVFGKASVLAYLVWEWELPMNVPMLESESA